MGQIRNERPKARRKRERLRHLGGTEEWFHQKGLAPLVVGDVGTIGVVAIMIG